tara:strand:- start:641 stop:1282 length:642 start_codon:yes stop_codon:yes gene_type:complete
LNKKNILAIWSFRNDLPLKKITKNENEFIKQMSDSRAYQFIHSRGYVRYALSKVFNENPLEIPLNARPYHSPELPPYYGHISFSHCKDMLVVAWCMERIGIDIEREDRQISNMNNFKKLFSDDIKSIDKEYKDRNVLRSQILDLWVIKESLVKWEKSSIFDGMKNWNLFKSYNYAINGKSGLKVKIQNIDFNDWKIGVASNHSRNFHPLQVCI